MAVRKRHPFDEAARDFVAAVELPAPALEGTVSVEAALRSRHSIREFRRGAIPFAEVSQLLWAAQGPAAALRSRTAPSAGALYPLEIYLLAGEVEALEPGIYRYDAARHGLDRITDGDRRDALSAAALGQSWLADAPAIFVIAANYGRTEAKYGKRALRYVHIEAGLAAENICLEVTPLGLGTTVVGAFEDDWVTKVACLREPDEPLLLLPVGRPRA